MTPCGMLEHQPGLILQLRVNCFIDAQVCIGANLLSLARDVLHVVNLGWERQLLTGALLLRLACAEDDVRGKLFGVGSRVLTSLAILIAALDVLVEMAVIASLT